MRSDCSCWRIFVYELAENLPNTATCAKRRSPVEMKYLIRRTNARNDTVGRSGAVRFAYSRTDSELMAVRCVGKFVQSKNFNES
jgi:hypothetical protein